MRLGEDLSIPPQATIFHAPQRPFRVLGRFYKSGSFSTKAKPMPRLLLEHGGNLRHLASIEAAHDGSISLALVRQGDNDFGWESSGSAAGVVPFQQVDFEAPRARTKRITIHTSGRVNYHYQKGPGKTVFVPCLLDITEKVPIVAYVVPRVELLDVVEVLNVKDASLQANAILAQRGQC